MSYARTRTSRSKKKRSIPRWLVVIAPLLGGILVTPFAVRAASVLAMSGPHALWLLYPFVPVVLQHFTTNQDETLAQWIMYGQFPLYGVIWILMARLARGSAGVFSVAVLHCLGVAAAVLDSSGS